MFNKPPEKLNEDFFQMDANDVIRGHKMTDKEANERIWREIDQAFFAIEPISLEVVRGALRQEIEKLYIIKTNLKENKNENNS